MNKKLKLFISLIIPQLAAVVGSVFTARSVSTWYTTIVRPEWNPPSWIFGPVWTTLFILMGIALYLVWTREGVSEALKKRAYNIFGAQLVLNILWSVAFFGLQNPGLALFVIALLWLMILLNILIFRKISRTAERLLWPYLAWVSFATYLNYAIWILN